MGILVHSYFSPLHILDLHFLLYHGLDGKCENDLPHVYKQSVFNLGINLTKFLTRWKL